MPISLQHMPLDLGRTQWYRTNILNTKLVSYPFSTTYPVIRYWKAWRQPIAGYTHTRSNTMAIISLKNVFALWGEARAPGENMGRKCKLYTHREWEQKTTKPANKTIMNYLKKKKVICLRVIKESKGFLNSVIFNHIKPHNRFIIFTNLFIYNK